MINSLQTWGFSTRRLNLFMSLPASNWCGGWATGLHHVALIPSPLSQLFLSSNGWIFVLVMRSGVELLSGAYLQLVRSQLLLASLPCSLLGAHSLARSPKKTYELSQSWGHLRIQKEDSDIHRKRRQNCWCSKSMNKHLLVKIRWNQAQANATTFPILDHTMNSIQHQHNSYQQDTPSYK